MLASSFDSFGAGAFPHSVEDGIQYRMLRGPTFFTPRGDRVPGVMLPLSGPDAVAGGNLKSDLLFSGQGSFGVGLQQPDEPLAVDTSVLQRRIAGLGSYAALDQALSGLQDVPFDKLGTVLSQVQLDLQVGNPHERVVAVPSDSSA